MNPMKRTLHKTLALAALAAVFPHPLFAHRFWILPSTSVLSGENQWVTIDAAISNDLFFPNHHAPALSAFTVTGPDGAKVEIKNGSEGKIRSTFDIELTAPGTYRIATVRGMLGASWEEDGETRRWRGDSERFAAEGIASKPGVKVSRNHSRVETFVTAGEPDTTALKPTGEGLELVADKTHPNDLFAGEKASFVLHANGKPAKGCKVTVIRGDDRYRDEVGEMIATTDGAGRFEIEWPEPGRYWLNASAEGEAGEVAGVPASQRFSYTATFEVLPQ